MDDAERLARRAEQAHAVRRRRRRMALTGIVVAAVAVVAVVLLAGGGGAGGSKRASATGAGAATRASRAKHGTGAGKPAPAAAISAGAPGAHHAASEPVPILMYHVIGTARPGIPFPELWVTASDFSSEMKALAARGYHGVTLQQVWDAWHNGGLLPSKPVVVSFDDGYSGQYVDALPTLRALGWPAVLNLKLGNLRDLHADRIRGMIAAGWEIDSHTINHPELTAIGPEQLRYELEQSRARLRREFGVPASFFCYPAGRYDSTVIAAVKRAGYLAATTTDYGFARPGDTYVLGRVRVNGSDGASGLVHKLDALASQPNSAPVLRVGGG
jgi:peptidoglycan/xylan/chitin deacetylase (PgdA/CDA1 family)